MPQGPSASAPLRAFATRIVCVGVLARGMGCTRSAHTPMDVYVGDVVDATADVGSVDVGVDAGFVDSPTTVNAAGWATPGWLPVGTDLQFATQPATMVAALGWQPCADGTAGCQEFDATTLLQIVWPVSLPHAFDGTTTWFKFIRTLPSDPTYEIDALAPLDGPVAIAWRSPGTAAGPHTGVATISLANPGFLTEMLYLPPGMNPDDPAASLTLAYVYSDATHPLLSAEPLLAGSEGTTFGGDSPQYVYASGTAFGFSAQSLVASITFGPPVKLRLFRQPSGAFQRWQPVVSGNSFFWEADYTRADGSYRDEIWVAPPGGSPVQLLADPVKDIVGFDTDGTTMVWVTCADNGPTGGRLPHAQLWSAPFTTNPAGLLPHLVASFTNGSQLGDRQFGAGYYATSNGTDTWLFQLATGATWHLLPPSGEGYTFTTFLNATEIGLTMRGVLRGDRIRRLRLDSLGPPITESP